MEEKLQPSQEFNEVNKLRRKSQLKKVRKEEKFGFLFRIMLIIQELCRLVVSFPRTTHTDFLIGTVCSVLLNLFSCLLFLDTFFAHSFPQQHSCCSFL